MSWTTSHVCSPPTAAGSASRTAAELKQRRRTLQHIALSPSRIGDITRAALTLNGIWK